MTPIDPTETYFNSVLGLQRIPILQSTAWMPPWDCTVPVQDIQMGPLNQDQPTCGYLLAALMAGGTALRCAASAGPILYCCTISQTKRFEGVFSGHFKVKPPVLRLGAEEEGLSKASLYPRDSRERGKGIHL
jgi:hypothetical protein